MRRYRPAFGRFACALSLFLLVAGAALAQEAASGPAETETSTGWVFRWINFAIIVVLIAWGFLKAAPALRANSEEISRKIAEGARARERAEQLRREAQAKLAGIGEEVARLKAEAQRGAEAEAQRIRAMAREEAQKIERAAQAEIAASERAARLELKSLAARMAVERAAAVVRGQMTPQAEQSLFHAFVEQLAGSAN
ncbi:MAG TPA: ATP synthase F0 subunit B [Candidatus Acidoferrales bacterium]|nr:ATP synthase F0 subunit B [Candidatus Acidoferrales bacterium]